MRAAAWREHVPLLLIAALYAVWSWVSGPPVFDSLDGTEFVICARGLEIPHPPGYPLFVFLLRAATAILPCPVIDYSCVRVVTTLLAAMGLLAARAALRELGLGRVASTGGALLFYTLAPVASQTNIVEIHGMAMLLAFAAVALRSSRLGPYAFSLSVFGGHPVSALLLPLVLTRRFRERWAVLAAIPASLWLFVPIRATFPALSHYSYPASLDLLGRYMGLYGPRLDAPGLRNLSVMLKDLGLVSGGALLGLIAGGGRWRPRAAAGSLLGLLFVSSYNIVDIDSLLWIPLLPLSVWAAAGLEGLLRRGRAGRAAAAVLVAASVAAGSVGAWRGGDVSASLLSRDMLRGVGYRGAYCTVGFVTFHTAYLMDVEDRRPDIIPLDTYECYYRLPPPDSLPPEIAGRTVFTTRGWEQDRMKLAGMLFTSDTMSVDWEMFDIFRRDHDIPDGYASDAVAEVWARRAIQTEDPMLRDSFEKRAMDYAVSPLATRRIQIILETL